MLESFPDLLIWLGILFCITQSAMFSGLNLAFFSVSRLSLEIEAANNNAAAQRVLALRQDSNLLLATVLWGNVAINVLLTMLSNSVMFGLTSFLFSTFVITIGGEILPQAYFSRNALRMASLLSPVLRFYQVLLFVVNRPTAWFLNLWLGAESVQYMREKDLRQLIHKHIDASETDLEAVEGIGALNFLAIDDARVRDEGQLLVPETIIALPFRDGRPVFADAEAGSAGSLGEFIAKIRLTRLRWIILVDPGGAPAWALDAHSYLRDIQDPVGRSTDPMSHCHRPVVVTDPHTRLGAVIALFKSQESAQSDTAFPHRIILFWGIEKRIITAGDVLGRLFKGIGLYSSINRTVTRRSAA